MSFSETDEDKLINLVAKYSVIYDGEHSDYRNTLVKDNIWKIIGKELNKNGEDCKKKWKFIRDGYNRFKKTHKLGTGLPVPKNSKDKRHQQLTFLDGMSQHRSGGSKIPNSPPQIKENEEIAEANLNYEEEVSANEFTGVDTSLSNVTENCSEKVIIDKSREENIQSKGQRLKRYNEDSLLKLWKERDEKRQCLIKSMMEKKDDDVELFCRHMGEVLRNLPPVQKAKAKKDLNLVLSEYEIVAAKNATETQS